MINRSFTPFPILKTDRLILRQLLISDDKELFALRSNEKVNKYLDRTPNKIIEDSQIFIETILKNQLIYWAITMNNQLIGTICLFGFEDSSGKAEIGFELLPDFQGKGIMYEATSKVIEYSFEMIQLNLLEGFVHKENQPSRKLLKKLNFKLLSNNNSIDTDFDLFQLMKY